jgi:hypothetical protein
MTEDLPFVAPERTTLRATGLTEDPVPNGFLRQLALPLTLRRGGTSEMGQ